MKRSINLLDSSGTRAAIEQRFQLTTLKDKCAEIIAKDNFQLEQRSLPNEVLELVYSKLFCSRQLTNSNVAFFCRLERIDLRHNNVTDNGIRSLAIASKGVKLRSLNLSCLSITDDTAYALATCCPHLQFLDLSGCVYITDVTLLLIGTYLHQLRHLNVSGCPQITDDGLKWLSSLKNLHQVSFANCTNMNGKTLHHLRRLPINELDISANQFSVKLLSKIPRYFPKLTKINLANCVQVTDSLLELVITKCAFLRHIDLESIPLLTNKTLHLLCLNSFAISTVNLRGNYQLDLKIIAILVNKGLHLIGGSIELVVLRNRSCLDNIILLADLFTPVSAIRQRVLEVLRKEKVSEEEDWQENDLLFQKVTYRKNGTMRPSDFVSEKEFSSVLVAILGNNKTHLYLQTTKLPEQFTFPQQNIVITLRRWKGEDHKPIDVGDVSVNPDITLLEFKQIVQERYLPSMPLEKMLVVEEETPLHVNILLNNTITLKNYALVTGDVLHVEEITEAHYTFEGAAGQSSTAKYLAKKKVQLSVQETAESFTRRKRLALANNTIQIPKNAINLQIRLSGWAKFEKLQLHISDVCGIPSKAQRLFTRIHPQVFLEGPQKAIVEVVSGNTWIMMEVL